MDHNREVFVCYCKDCTGTVQFPERLTILQAKLHKRKNPDHVVIISG